MSYEREEDVTKKLTTFLETTDMISGVLQPSKFHKQTRLQTYSTLAVL
jgi:hypothetical protein